MNLSDRNFPIHTPISTNNNSEVTMTDMMIPYDTIDPDDIQFGFHIEPQYEAGYELMDTTELIRFYDEQDDLVSAWNDEMFGRPEDGPFSDAEIWLQENGFDREGW